MAKQLVGQDDDVLELREMRFETLADNNFNMPRLQSLPVAAEGTRDVLEVWAKQNRLMWLRDSGMLYGGYFRNKKGDVWFPVNKV